MEAMDRAAMSRALFAPLRALIAAGRLNNADAAAAIAACAEGYAFPTNLDTDPPTGGLAPKSQAAIMAEALDGGSDLAAFSADLDAWSARRTA